MSAAYHVKSARARANIAARMYLNNKTLSRAFDDCFEMGDGMEVANLLLEMAKNNKELYVAMAYTHRSHTPREHLSILEEHYKGINPFGC